MVLAVTEDADSRSLLGQLNAQAAARLSESAVFDDARLFDRARVFEISTELAALMACSWLKAQCDGHDGRGTVHFLAADHLRALSVSSIIGAWAATCQT